MKEIKELIALKAQIEALEAQKKDLIKTISEYCLTNGVKEVYDEDGNKAILIQKKEHWVEGHINRAHNELRTYKA